MVFTSQVTGTPKEKKKGKKKPNERQGQKLLIINFLKRQKKINRKIKKKGSKVAGAAAAQN